MKIPRFRQTLVEREGYWVLPMIGLGLCCLCAAVPRTEAAEPAAVPSEETSQGTPDSQPTPTAAQIGLWIEQLGDDAFAVRQMAADRLLSAGAIAREPLQAVAEGPDPEIRAAARRLVMLIDGTEFQRRLEAFAADTDGRRGLTLPGWEAFRELAGDDAGARSLFVDMQRHEAKLLDAVFSDRPREGDPPWEPRLLRLLNWRVAPGNRVITPPMGSCATMLFLGSLDEFGVSDQAATQLFQLIQRPPLRDALQQGQRDAVRRLVVGWIVHCPNESQGVLQQRMQLALRHGLTEALPLALAVAHGDPKYLTVNPMTRVTAILTVGRLAQAEQASELEPLLEDTTVCITSIRGGNLPQQALPDVQVRDVALAVMLHLTKQDLKQYGFQHFRRHAESLFDVRTLGMENDEQRAAAMDQWKKWKAGQGK